MDLNGFDDIKDFALVADRVKLRLEEIGRRIGDLRYPMIVMEDEYFEGLADKLTGGKVRHAEIELVALPTSDCLIGFVHSDILFSVIDVAHCMPDKLDDDPDFQKLSGLLRIDTKVTTPSQRIVRKSLKSAFAYSCRVKAYEERERARMAADLKRSFEARVELLERERDLLLEAMETGVINEARIARELDDHRARLCINFRDSGLGANPGFELRTFNAPRGLPDDAFTEADLIQAALTTDLLLSAGSPEFEESSEMHEVLLLLELLKPED